MKINRDNYEQYFLDHAEGTLSPEMEKELGDFLAANPDLGDMLEGFDSTPLPAANIKNDPLKKRLKKNIRPTAHIREADVDEWLIREAEGLLTEAESTELDMFLALNPAYAFDHKIMRLARLEPDQQVTFPRKAQLKKRAPLVTFTRVSLAATAAAAVIIVLIGIRIFQDPAVDPVAPVSKPAVSIVAEGTPSHSGGTPSRSTGTPSHVVGTPSRSTETPSHTGGTPSRSTGTPSPHFSPILAQSIQPVKSTGSETIHLTFYQIPELQTGDLKEKSLVASVFVNIVNKTRDVIQGNPDIAKIRKADLDFWSIAKVGVDGYNRISDRELELFVRKDDNGTVKSYAIVDQEKLLLSRELNKE